MDFVYNNPTHKLLIEEWYHHVNRKEPRELLRIKFSDEESILCHTFIDSKSVEEVLRIPGCMPDVWKDRRSWSQAPKGPWTRALEGVCAEMCHDAQNLYRDFMIAGLGSHNFGDLPPERTSWLFSNLPWTLWALFTSAKPITVRDVAGVLGGMPRALADMDPNLRLFGEPGSERKYPVVPGMEWQYDILPANCVLGCHVPATATVETSAVPWLNALLSEVGQSTLVGAVHYWYMRHLIELGRTYMWLRRAIALFDVLFPGWEKFIEMSAKGGPQDRSVMALITRMLICSAFARENSGLHYIRGHAIALLDELPLPQWIRDAWKELPALVWHMFSDKYAPLPTHNVPWWPEACDGNIPYIQSAFVTDVLGYSPADMVIDMYRLEEN